MRFFRDLPTVYLHRDMADFGKPIDGRAAIVEQKMKLDPFADGSAVWRQRDQLTAGHRHGSSPRFGPEDQPSLRVTDELKKNCPNLGRIPAE